ncbi:hypothetical protein ACFO0A_08040 [Novosphingobium tardum]|uniref:Uncharacterized protein n=1 Tax=Novosphingobium tardum TaxID=1538021 RepID=A0ABV8RRZ0_9SPHN
MATRRDEQGDGLLIAIAMAVAQILTQSCDKIRDICRIACHAGFALARFDEATGGMQSQRIPASNCNLRF